MATKVQMLKLSDTMEEGVVLKWLKQEGDPVEPGDILAEVETDKAIMELEAYDPGVLRHISVQEGEPVPVGTTLAVIGDPDEDITVLLEEAPAPPVEQEEAPAAEAVEEAVPPPSEVEERLKASPLARRMAEERGIDLTEVRGSGPGGRITKQDIEEYTPKVEVVPIAPAQPPPEAEYEEISLSMMRKAIARRTTESKAPVPHFYLTAEIDMKQAMAFRESLNALEEGLKISFNDMIVKAVAGALAKFPGMNAAFAGDKVRVMKRIHIGIVVAVEDGIITPVIEDCDKKSLGQIAREGKDLVVRAKERKLRPEEYTGGTFTVSNMGMYGVESFSAVIAPPEAAILAVGAIVDKPVVEREKIVVGHRMRVTLSCDHRTVDGVVGAQFLEEFKRTLEHPVRLMM